MDDRQKCDIPITTLEHWRARRAMGIHPTTEDLANVLLTSGREDLAHKLRQIQSLLDFIVELPRTGD